MRVSHAVICVFDDPNLDNNAHRTLMGNLMKRSTFLLAHRINDSEERRERTGGEESLSTRYFEATAGGAVILGSEPRTPQFAESFDWPDAVIDLPYSGEGLQELLHQLRSDPARLALASAAGVDAGLRRHNWAHQWQQVLVDSDLPPAPGLIERLDRLRAAAEEATVACSRLP